MPGSYNAIGIEVSDGFRKSFPEGEYDLRIISAVPGKIQNGVNAGCDKVVINFSVIGGPYDGRHIKFYTVSFLPPESKGAGIVLNFLKCIGEPYEGEFSWNETNWIGKRLRASVIVEPDNRGRMWNRVASVMAPIDPIVDSDVTF